MDEVDNIIIETLRALNCNLAEDVTSLKQFDEDLVILSISTCLEAIIPQTNFPKKLSPSMALRLKTASHLAEQIKDIGFKEDIGYQTILYFNEVEIRRLLIFLIEKLPRDSGSSTQTEEVGYVPKLLTVFRQKLRESPSLWIPSSLLNRGTHCKGDSIDFRSYGHSVELKTKKLIIPSESDIEYKNYNVHILPTVTKQCTPNQLIPSLLFEDCRFSSKNRTMLKYLQNNISKTKSEVTISSKPTIDERTSPNNKKNLVNSTETVSPIAEVAMETENIQSISELLRIEEERYMLKKEQVELKQLELTKLDQTRQKEAEILQDSTAKFKIKTKTIAVLSQEENLQKLHLLIDKASSRLVELSSQWNEVESPLLKEYQFLQNSVSEQESFLKEKENQIRNIVLSYEEMLKDLKEKVLLEQKLLEKHKQISKNTKRSTYTKNIMEIIANIKKQNYEIQKILEDTRQVQKDINSLTGQIERSFTISDELIFLNAKKDETSRMAYKLLVSLHNECGEIVRIVSDIGFVERECRNLQELLDIETAKDTAVKLNKLTEDLKQIREENMTLGKQVQ